MVQRGDIAAGAGRARRAPTGRRRSPPPCRSPGSRRGPRPAPWEVGSTRRSTRSTRRSRWRSSWATRPWWRCSSWCSSGLWARLYRGDLRDAEERALAVRDLAGDRATAEGRALLGGRRGPVDALAGSGHRRHRPAARRHHRARGAVDPRVPAAPAHHPRRGPRQQPASRAATPRWPSPGRCGGRPGSSTPTWASPRPTSPPPRGTPGPRRELADDAATEAAAKGNRLFGLLAAHTAFAIAPDDGSTGEAGRARRRGRRAVRRPAATAGAALRSPGPGRSRPARRRLRGARGPPPGAARLHGCRRRAPARRPPRRRGPQPGCRGPGRAPPASGWPRCLIMPARPRRQPHPARAGGRHLRGPGLVERRHRRRARRVGAHRREPPLPGLRQARRHQPRRAGDCARRLTPRCDGASAAWKDDG